MLHLFWVTNLARQNISTNQNGQNKRSINLGGKFLLLKFPRKLRNTHFERTDWLKIFLNSQSESAKQGNFS